MILLLTEMFSFLKKSKGGACQLADEGAQYNKTNADHFDDLDQKYLHGTLHINIEKESLRKEVGVIDKANFNDINVDLLCQALSACYQMDIKPVHLKACRRISVKGTISITFHNTLPGSTFMQLVTKMKSKGANVKDLDLYANFALTMRQSKNF